MRAHHWIVIALNVAGVLALAAFLILRPSHRPASPVGELEDIIADADRTAKQCDELLAAGNHFAAKQAMENLASRHQGIVGKQFAWRLRVLDITEDFVRCATPGSVVITSAGETWAGPLPLAIGKEVSKRQAVALKSGDSLDVTGIVKRIYVEGAGLRIEIDRAKAIER